MIKTIQNSVLMTLILLLVFSAPVSLVANNQRWVKAKVNQEKLQEYKTNELIVSYKGDAKDRSFTTKKLKARVLRSIGGRLVKIKLPKEISINTAIKMYKQDPNVEYVHPNFIYRITYTPNDTYYLQQWYLQNIMADRAWDTTQGSSNLIIAIVDTGVDLNHPDLNANLVGGYNFVANNSNPQDDQGHGTHVAGIAAAVTNNNRGVSGIAGKVKIMPIKVINRQGEGGDFEVAAGIRYAVDHGAKIINLSFGQGLSSATLKGAIDYADSKGVLIIGSAGNDYGGEVLYPAKYSNVMAVTATNQADKLATFSNFGPQVEVSAPGESVLSSLWDFGSTYGYGSGTSMAAPLVSGLAALIWSVDPNFSVNQVKQIIKDTASDLGDRGYDTKFGYGKINAYNAINKANKLKSIFKDVKGDYWAAEEIKYLVAKDIINGYSDGSFKPEESVTRAQAVVMLVKALKLPLEYNENSFSDIAKTHWAYAYINSAANNGIINGYSDGTFRPNDSVTRAQMSVMLMKAFRLVAKEMHSFQDVSSDYWASQAISSVTSAGVATGYNDGTFRPGRSTTRAQLSVFLVRAIEPKFRIQ